MPCYQNLLCILLIFITFKLKCEQLYIATGDRATNGYAGNCSFLRLAVAVASPSSPPSATRERASEQFGNFLLFSLFLSVSEFGSWGSLSLSLSVTPRFLRCSMHSYLCMGLGCVTVWATLDNSLPLSLA